MVVLALSDGTLQSRGQEHFPRKSSVSLFISFRELGAAAECPQATLRETVMTAVKEPHFLKPCGLLLDRKSTQLWQVHFDD
jgi:hypothetical protein